MRGASKILLAASAVGLVWAMVSWAFCPFENISVQDGAGLFHYYCADCHAVQAIIDTRPGPNLSEIGHVATTRVTGMSAEEYLLESITDPSRRSVEGQESAMPEGVVANLRRDQVLSIIAFLMTQGGEVNYRRLAALDGQAAVPRTDNPAKVDVAAAEAGRHLFLGSGQCIHCHPLRDLPDADLLGPSLLRIGRRDRAYLREAIQDPGRHVALGYRTTQVVLKSGRILTGRRVRSSPDGLSLLTESTGSRRVIDIRSSDIDSDEDGKLLLVERSESHMPVPTQLTDEDVTLLVEFLSSVKY